jgi:AcrR family transcriptional regulator
LGKKQDLLKAAVQLFSKQGYDGTTTFEIAKTAHVTEPVIHFRFKNKDGFSLISFPLTKLKITIFLKPYLRKVLGLSTKIR